jgi:tetratricopeptide (TPR) repeat protein
MRPEKRVQIVGLVWLILHGMAGLGWLNGMWGIHYLHFYPGWAQGLFLGLGGLILLPVVQDRLLAFVNWGLDQTAKIRHLRPIFLVLIFLVFFVYFRSVVFLLGDGALYLCELDATDLNGFDRVDRSPLVFWLTVHIEGLGLGPVQTYQLYSWVSGGLYIGVAFYAARIIGTCRVSRVVILGLLLTTGYMQLFFGYVETYALVMPVGLVYLLLGLAYAQDRLGWWWPASFLGLLIPLHLVHVFWVPSLIVLIWRHSPKRLRDTFLTLGLTGGLACALLLLSGLLPWALLRQRGDVPWLGLHASLNQAYSTFSMGHILDVWNQYVLVVPVVFMGFVLRLFQVKNLSSQFLATAALGVVVFSGAANPMIGAFRDWDVMGISGLPVVVWMCWHWAERDWAVCQQKRVGMLVCGLAGLQVLMWVGVNAHTSRAEARFEMALNKTVLSPYARSYGWETLGGHYRAQGRPTEALAAYEAAILADPEHPRHRNSAGNLLRQMGRPEEALLHLERAVDIMPGFAEAYSNLGNTLSALDRYDDALKAYGRALALNPDLAETYTNMGIVFHNLAQFEQAVAHHKKAIETRPNFAKAYSNLGSSLNRLGRFEEAIGFLQQALDQEPDFAEAHANMGTALRSIEKHEDAIRHFQTAVSLDPNLTWAHLSLGLAYMAVQRLGKALKAFDGAIFQRPNFAQAYHSSGVAYLQMNDFGRAREYFEKTLEIDPDYAHAAGIRA